MLYANQPASRWLLGLHGLAATVATAFGRNGLEYDRAAVSAGESWRLLTGSYVHTNATHLALNLAALALLYWIAPARTRTAFLLLLPMLGLGVMVSEHLLLAHRWACGLSGPLHGMAAVMLVSRQAGKAGVLLGASAVIKAGFEAWSGASAGTEALIEAPVLVEHHLIGAITGLTVAAAVVGLRYTAHRNTPDKAHEVRNPPHSCSRSSGMRDGA